MYSDISGFAPEWLKTAGIIGAIVGAVLVVVAITILTGGVGTATLVGAIAVGAAHGVLIGAAIGVGVGALAGGVGSLIAGEQFGSAGFWSNVGYGALAGFGAGALIGAVAGGMAGSRSWYAARALEFTQTGVNNEVVLGNYIQGSSNSYEAVASSRGSTYFSVNQARWSEVRAMTGVGDKGMLRINQIFLKQQIALGRSFVLSSDYFTVSLTNEIGYLLSNGILPILIP